MQRSEHVNARADEVEATADDPSGAAESPDAFVCGGLEVLYEEDPARRCDACAEEVLDDDEGYGLTGAGEYMQSRGGDVRFEAVPLCGRCGTAIFAAAMQRWEIEDEEG
jgi:hypothetical protein